MDAVCPDRPPVCRDLRQLCPAITEAFQSCDALLAKEPRMVVTEHENPSDGKQFEVRWWNGGEGVVESIRLLSMKEGKCGTVF